MTIIEGGDTMKKLNNLRLLTIVAVLALAILIAVGSTFSWSPRTVDSTDTNSYRNFNYEFSGRVNYLGLKDVAPVTYEGISENGDIDYSETPVSGEVTLSGENIKYFKTVIDNKVQNQGSALFSLYVDGMKFTQSLGANINVGIFTPEKTYDTTLVEATGANGYYNVNRFCLEDNLFVANNSECVVYWFVKFDSAPADAKLDIGNIQIVCN